MILEGLLFDSSYSTVRVPYCTTSSDSVCRMGFERIPGEVFAVLLGSEPTTHWCTQVHPSSPMAVPMAGV